MSEAVQSASVTRCGRRNGGAYDDGGFAMLMVLVFIMASLLTMTAGYEYLRQVIAAEEAGDRVPDGGDGIAEALGIGVARLQTGEPPRNDYTCRVILRTSAGDASLHYDLIHKKQGQDRWLVEAQPADDSEPECPPVFSDECPLVSP